MRTGNIVFLLAALFVLIGGTDLIGAALPQKPAAEDQQSEAVERSFPPRSPVVRAMRERLELESDQLRALTERYRAAADEAEALVVVREIALLKRQTQIDLVVIQLDHMRRIGADEAAAQLEATLEDLRRDEYTGEPRPRDAVARESEQR